MIGLLAAAGHSPKINWGAVPDWIAGLGTVASLVFLTVALVREIRSRRVDDARREAERRDLEARHARRVSITVHQASGLSLELQIANDGDGPIFDVVPGYAGADVRNPVRISRMAAGEVLQRDVGSTAVLSDGAAVIPTVEFTDTEGLRWRRIAGGQPVRQLIPAP